MSDNSQNKKPLLASIPSWQRTPTPETSNQVRPQSSEVESTSSSNATKADRGILSSQVEIAAKFLEDESIKNESRARKVAFLQTKGIPMMDIEKLLGTEADESKSTESKEVHSSTATQESSMPRTVRQLQQQPDTRSIVPPIVTYPEFLVQAQKPPPLVTTQRLLTTAYITGGLIATMYGLSKYLVNPMSETLAAARHEFFEHTAAHLDDLNSRLEKNVSEVPSQAADHQRLLHNQEDGPPSPTDSDPTELFHRDVGTQTSPELEISSTDHASQPEEVVDATSQHEKRIKSLTSCVSELNASSDLAKYTDSTVTIHLNDLTTYLDNMTYRDPQYDYLFNADSKKNPEKSKSGKDGEDEIDKIKSEIRNMKGVLLNARNFPGSRVPTVGVK